MTYNRLENKNPSEDKTFTFKNNWFFADWQNHTDAEVGRCKLSNNTVLLCLSGFFGSVLFDHISFKPRLLAYLAKDIPSVSPINLNKQE